MSDRHEHLDEGTIHAWLDGALPPDESARVEAEAARCTECAALVAEARGLIAASSRILSSLDAVPAGVIPGRDGNVDQLAALRARHTSRKRNWWNDRRIVAAASLVFVAGLSTMIWRYAPGSAKAPVTEQSLDASQPAAESIAPVAAAPVAGAPANESGLSSRSAPARDARAEARVPAVPSAPAPMVVRETDTTTERKAASTMALPRLAANEARVDSSLADRTRQAESRRLSRIGDDVATQQAAKQQGAVGQQQGFRQLRPDTMRVSAPPPSFGAGARVAQSVVGAAADAQPPACYRIQATSTVPDSVKLFNEQLPILSDPAWFRAEYIGRSRAPIELFWMRVDSVTIDVRVRSADSLGVRFTTNSTLPSLGREGGVRAVTATRIICP